MRSGPRAGRGRSFLLLLLVVRLECDVENHGCVEDHFRTQWFSLQGYGDFLFGQGVPGDDPLEVDHFLTLFGIFVLTELLQPEIEDRQ